LLFHYTALEVKISHEATETTLEQGPNWWSKHGGSSSVPVSAHYNNYTWEKWIGKADRKSYGWDTQRGNT